MWGRKPCLITALPSGVFRGRPLWKDSMPSSKSHIGFSENHHKDTGARNYVSKMGTKLIFHLMGSKEDRNKSHPQERHWVGRTKSNCSLLSGLLRQHVDPRVVPLQASLLVALNQVTWGCLLSFNSEYELYTLTALLLGLFCLVSCFIV